jgi:hypothetical protein
VAFHSGMSCAVDLCIAVIDEDSFSRDTGRRGMLWSMPDLQLIGDCEDSSTSIELCVFVRVLMFSMFNRVYSHSRIRNCRRSGW